jgi:transcriptional regulator with XRE-family HTH domain
MSALELHFGQAVRAARTNRGWSQEQLAEIANLNRSYLGEIERGVVTPSLSTIGKIAAALQVKPSVLISQCESSAGELIPLQT